MEWIDIEKEKPPIGKTCLLYITYPEGTRFNCLAYPLQRQNIRIGGRNWEEKWVSYEKQRPIYDCEYIKYVSHWAELPEGPKE